MTQPIALSAVFELSPDRLTLKFSVKNDGNDPIYLTDLAFDVSATGVAPRPDHLVVTFPEPHLAVLSSKLYPLDPNINFATPLKIYATPVPAHQRYDGVASAALPLAPQGWRQPRDEQGTPLTDRVKYDVCDRIRFELGVIPGAGLPVKLTEMAGIPVGEFGVPAIKAQIVLSTEQSGLNVRCIAP
jgi:hypothetical protein